MTRNSPPKLGGEPARTKSEQAGWFPCRYWQLREPPRPRLRSGTPPNLGGECPHSNSFTAPMSARDVFFVQSRTNRSRQKAQKEFFAFCGSLFLCWQSVEPLRNSSLRKFQGVQLSQNALEESR